MALFLGWLTVLTLGMIAALHVVWGLGYTWPDKDSKSLALRVAGFKNIQTMPSLAACFAVAVFLIFAGLIILWTLGHFDPLLPIVVRKLILVGMAAGFCIRGIFSFLPFWRRMTPEQPFARLDRRYYGPLCLCLSLMLIGIAILI
jgi:Protein of unknown function (DUF3995)